MNGFFQHEIKLKPGTKARAEDVNARFDAIVEGFDKFPAPSLSGTGFSEPLTVGTPTGTGHAVTAGTALGGGLSYSADIGVANAYVVNLAVPPVSYKDGLTVSFKALNANTGASTINVNGLGGKHLCRSNGSPLVAGDIAAGQIITVVFNGTRFLATAALAGQFSEMTANVQATVNQGVADCLTVKNDAIAACETVRTNAVTDTTAVKNAAISACNVVKDETTAIKDQAVINTAAQVALAQGKVDAADAIRQEIYGVLGSSQAITDAVNVTATNRAATAADRVQTGLDRVATGQDRTQTGQDRTATAADRVQTSQDRVQTGEDRAAVTALLASADVSTKANINSPTLTGTPTAPTAATGTNTNQIATTAFVAAEMALVGAKPTYAISGTSLAVAGALHVFTAQGTLQLPVAPAQSTRVYVYNKSGLKTCVIDPGAERINGINGTMIVDILEASFTLYYSGATYGWVTQ